MRPLDPRAAALAGAMALVAFVLLLPPALRKDLDHDEHQFVASAVLLLEEGRLPYRDYPYFHMPNLVFVYAGLFGLTESRLLAARTFSVACAAVAVGLVALVTLAAFPPRARPAALAAAGAALLLLANPVFRYTTGRTWNHDLPTVLTLGAFAVHVLAGGRPGARMAPAASGALLGLAAGTRLAYLPAVVPFAVVLLVPPPDGRRAGTVPPVAWFAGGVALALLPALVLFALAPEQFLFGNYGYRELSTLQKAEVGHRTAMTLEGKVRYLKDALAAPGNLALALSLVVVVPWRSLLRRRSGRGRRALGLALLLVPFLLAGSLVPTPTFYQYLYAPVPFAVLAVALAFAARWERAEAPTVHGKVFALAVLAAVAWGCKDYRDLGLLLAPERWYPTVVRQAGLEIRRAAGEGPVLTLAPIFPLEGGVRIYDELATGPFAWRSGHLLAPEDRRRLGVVSPAELPGLVAAEPPRAILVGFEPAREGPLAAYAVERGYRPTPVPGGGTLWVAPGTDPRAAGAR